MLIHAKPYGRLGNRLYLFAHLLAFSLEHDVPICMPSFWKYADCFETWRGSWLCRFPLTSRRRPGFLALRNFTRWGIYRVSKLVRRFSPNGRKWGAIVLPEADTLDLDSPEFIAAAKQKTLFVQGWKFRGTPNVIKHQDELRRMFRPIEPYRRRVEETIAAARKDCDRLVGVHVRQGDYRNYAGGKYNYSADAYRAFLDQVVELFPQDRVKFLICSDEPPPDDVWKPHRVVHGPGDTIEDMYTLAECDMILGPPSTYSGWASFFGSKPLLHLESRSDIVRLDRFAVHFC